MTGLDASLAADPITAALVRLGISINLVLDKDSQLLILVAFDNEDEIRLAVLGMGDGVPSPDESMWGMLVQDLTQKPIAESLRDMQFFQ
jgi:hypothetical protein